MYRNQAFTLAELAVIVIVVCVALVITVAISTGGTRCRGGHQLQNRTQTRGIQQGMSTFASGNGGYYPGLDSSGNLKPAITATAKEYGAAAPTNADQSIVYAILLTNSFFTPDYAVSTKETDSAIVAAPAITDVATIDQRRYSYALLQFAGSDNGGRRKEWRNTENSQCPAVTDRSMAIDPFLKTTSIHTQTTVADSAQWEGNIAWNDNHVTYETTGLINAGKTKVGDAAGSVDEVDDLFLDTPVKGLPQDTNVKMTYR